MNTTSGALVGENISKTYAVKGRADAVALKDCTFHFEANKLNVVMGTSGCGKSTLAYILAGYIAPDEGNLTLDGQPVKGPGGNRLMVFQETALWPWMTVEDNVSFGPIVRGTLSRAQAKARSHELLDKFGLGDFKTKYPEQLSGGMKRRAELAQALINSPDVMVLDEPFRGLDVMSRELMQEYFLRLFEDTGLTTIFITSELEEAIFLADRIYIMSDAPGRIVDVIEVDLPRPREVSCLTTERYRELKEVALKSLYSNIKAEESDFAIG